MKKLLIISVLLGLASCGEVIDSGHRGVEVSLGKVSEKPLKEGFYFYNPFSSSIQEIDTRTKQLTSATDAYTKDIQVAHISFVLNANIEQDNVHLLYQQIGVDSDGVEDAGLRDKIILPIVVAEIKTIVGTWEATDLIANRAKATSAILAKVKEKLAESYIVATNLELVNITYDSEFQKAVEAKVVAVQEAEKAKNNTVKIREEAEQRVISAKAEAESMRIRANALTANKSLVDYEAVQAQKEAIAKWDGKLPAQMMGGAIPFINISK